MVCDRFSDSTRAYQGAAGGASPILLSALEREVVDGSKPDLTLVFDLPAADGLKRTVARGEAATRFEARGRDFHERLRAAFLELARAEPERCVVVDATASPDEVETTIWRAVKARLEP